MRHSRSRQSFLKSSAIWPFPGQALSYKMGQLKILELRENAQKALGEKFDIKQFHKQVLDAGALPLNLLEVKVNNWIEQAKQ